MAVTSSHARLQKNANQIDLGSTGRYRPDELRSIWSVGQIFPTNSSTHRNFTLTDSSTVNDSLADSGKAPSQYFGKEGRDNTIAHSERQMRLQQLLKPTPGNSGDKPPLQGTVSAHGYHLAQYLDYSNRSSLGIFQITSFHCKSCRSKDVLWSHMIDVPQI